MHIRPLTAADVPAIAAAHAASRQKGYRGLIPDELTPGRTEDDPRPAVL